MKKRFAALCMLLAAALALGACKDGPAPAEKKKLDFSATVEDCFGDALSGVKVSLNGEDTASTDGTGAFTLRGVEKAESGSNVLALALEGFEAKSVELDGYFAEESNEEIDLGTFRLMRESAAVSSLETREWKDFEAFSLYATRSSESLLLKAVSPNRIFTEEGRNSTLEFYISAGEVGSGRDQNVTKITVDGNGGTQKKNYGQKDISHYSVQAEVAEQNGGVTVEIAVPFAMLGCGGKDIVGLGMGLYSEAEGARADLLALDGESRVDIFSPASYVRIDKNNRVFACTQNARPEDLASPLDRDALTAGYPLRFAVPALSRKGADADDFYLKAEEDGEGLLISMIGFGDFTEKEYVKLIVHTSETDGTGWKVQESDLNILVNKTNAKYKTGVTQFFSNAGGYSSFASGGTALANAPVYEEHGEYFTLTLKILYPEIPQYSESGKLSLFAMEFVDNGSVDGLIYDANDCLSGMLVDGISHGDPAAQSSYYVIRSSQEEAIDPALLEGYDMEFSMGAAHIYAKTERGATSLTLSLRASKPLGASDFVRFIVHAGEPLGANAWALDKKDVSFTVYKDAVYFQTGKVGFYQGKETQFHNGETALHAPVYTQSDGYWSLTFEVEYIELGDNVNASTQLRAFLGGYASGTLSPGAKQNGAVLGDQAYQSNWFLLKGGENA